MVRVNFKNKIVLLAILGIIISSSLTIIIASSFINKQPITIDNEEWEILRINRSRENNVEITELILKNQYITLRLYKISNNTHKIALIKIEDYCKYCYPNVGITARERLEPEHIETIREFKKYIGNLWNKHRDFIRQHSIVVDAYIVPSKALTIDEFRNLISKLKIGNNITWIYYSVYNKEYKYIMTGAVKVVNDIDHALSVITNDVEIYSNNKIIDKNNLLIYIGAFIVKTDLRELHQIQKEEHIGFIYVPIDIIKDLVDEGYTHIEIKYPTIIQAVPDINLNNI